MKRYLRKYGKSLRTIGLSFMAGAALVAMTPGLRVSSVLDRAGSPSGRLQDGQAHRPTRSECPDSDSPVSVLDETLIRPSAAPPTPEQGRVYVKSIAERNMFSRNRITVSANLVHDVTRAKNEDGPRAQQSLPFRLLGTVASSEGDSYAVLEVSDTKAQDIYCVGQTIAGVRIESIEQNRVVVLHNGNRQTLGLVLTGQPSTGVTPIAVPASVATKPQDMVRVVANGDREINTHSSATAKRAARSFLSKIRLSPCVNGEGLRISGLQDSTMAQLVGLKDGDVIQAVNNQSIGNQRKAVQVLKKARKLGQARLTIVRENQPRSLAFQTDSW